MATETPTETPLSERAVTRELAEYIVGIDVDRIPPEAWAAAKEAVLDQVGIMLTGSTLPWTQPTLQLVRDMASRPDSTIVGSGFKASVMDAAMVNANFGHSCELDDTGYHGGCHAGSLTVSSSLAIAEAHKLSGKDFLLGVITGYEVLYKIGRVVSREACDIGWHHQSVVGTFGAAAVASKLLGFDATTTLNALSIAGSHSSGTMEYSLHGGEVKRFHAAMAVHGGLRSALLAQRGLTGPPTILEGRRGIVRLFARVEEPERILDDLDSEWYAIQGRTTKFYPTVGRLHTSIQAFGRLIDEHGFKLEDIESVDVWVDHHTLWHGAAIQVPEDTVSAQFSMAFSLGLRLAAGRNHLGDYMDSARWRDPAILELGRKLHVHGDSSFGQSDDRVFTRGGARIAVTLHDGSRLEAEELYRKGSPRNPPTKAEHLEKFYGLAAAAIPRDRAEAVAALVNNIEDVDDMGQFVKLLVSD